MQGGREITSMLVEAHLTLLYHSDNENGENKDDEFKCI